MTIVEKEFNYSEAVLSGEELAREIEIAPRQVKGRMDNIPENFEYVKSDDGSFSIVEPIIYSKDEKIQSPVYFTPGGFVCGCGNLMAEDGYPKNGKITIFCANIYCTENLISKVVSLPSVPYQVSMSIA